MGLQWPQSPSPVFALVHTLLSPALPASAAEASPPLHSPAGVKKQTPRHQRVSDEDIKSGWQANISSTWPFWPFQAARWRPSEWWSHRLPSWEARRYFTNTLNSARHGVMIKFDSVSCDTKTGQCRCLSRDPPEIHSCSCFSAYLSKSQRWIIKTFHGKKLFYQWKEIHALHSGVILSSHSWSRALLSHCTSWSQRPANHQKVAAGSKKEILWMNTFSLELSLLQMCICFKGIIRVILLICFHVDS